MLTSTYLLRTIEGVNLEVRLTDLARKQLDRMPEHIHRKYEYWLDLISYLGLFEVRKYKGFHDEALKGERFGQRSVRLSKSYRLIYKEQKYGTFLGIEILEVNKHDY